MDRFEQLKQFALPIDSSNVKLQEREKTDVSVNDYINAEFTNFSENLLSLDDNELNRVLEDIDKKHKVNEYDPKTNEIVTATETLVNGILQAAGEIDSRFRSKCIYSGSYYDDLKVGRADEFDFVARIELLSRKNALEARRSERKRGFVYLVVKDASLLEVYTEFLSSPDDDLCLEKNDVILNVDSFQDYFVDLIFSAIKSIDIPDNFIFVKKYDGESDMHSNWRPIRHGPCATLYLSYRCQTTSDVVNLDIDIAPSIAYPEMHYNPPVLEKLRHLKCSNSFLEMIENICFFTEVMLVPFRFDYTEPSGKASWQYHYSNTWRVSHSSVEKAVFSLYKKDSVEKKLCRILKILKEIYLQSTLEVEIKSESRRLKLQEPPSTRLDFCTIEPVTSVSSEEYSSSTDTEDSDKESESDSQSSFEDNVLEEDEISNTKQIGQSEEASTNAESETGNDLEDLSKTKNFDQTQLKRDQKYEIIYDRQSMINSQYSKTFPPTSSSLCKTNVRFKSETQPDMKSEADFKLLGLPTFENKLKVSCQETEALSKDLKAPCRTLLSNIYERTSEMRNPNNIQVNRVSDLSSNVEKVNLKDNQGHELCYRDSKPLLKTYMIKMLFFAMKTAYPDQESWEPNRLSVLVKMAMCMIYYAHISKAKGIYNFWFQDLIENRTRTSTCTEVLYCLDRVVMHLSNTLKVDHNV